MGTATSLCSAIALGILAAATPASAQELIKFTPITTTTTLSSTLTATATSTVVKPATTVTALTPITAVSTTLNTAALSTVSTSTLVSASTIAYYPWLVYFIQPTAKCVHYDLTPCTNADLGNPYYRTILIMPSGYTEAERANFWTDFNTIVTQMSNTGTVWSTQKKAQMLYVGYYVTSGPLGAPDAAFHGAIMAHPIRDFALTLSLAEVKAKVAQIQASTYTNLRPLGVLCILNDFTDNVTANAAPPSFMGGSYGIAKMNRDDLKSGYIPTHELGHAALNFVDEYIEGGFENLNIRSIDIATPLVLFNGTWSGFIDAISDLFGIYDYNMSEILAANGNYNVALSSTPSTVASFSGSQTYAFEGGMFFGKGTFHAAGKNLMNSDNFNAGPENGFAWGHNPAQQMLIDVAFGAPANRANDRLRTAGPMNGWKGELGSTTTVMMYDGDKRNQFQKTQYYNVQVGWYERVWFTDYWYGIPYPNYRDEWRTAQKTVYPTERKIDLQASALYGLANTAQTVMCGLGFTEIPKPDGGVFKACEQPLSSIASAFLPTFVFATPYEEAQVPASQWFTTYKWRFAAFNGRVWSGNTGWSEFYRSF